MERTKYISGYLFVAAALYICAACSQVEGPGYDTPAVHSYNAPAPAVSHPSLVTSNPTVVAENNNSAAINNMTYWY